MKIGLTTSVVQRGKTGIAQYVLALTRAFLHRAPEHEFILFVLEEDLPLFDFARGRMNIVSVPEKFRPPLKDIFWHQFKLPRLVRQLGIDLLHVPSYRRMIWRRPCPLVATIATTPAAEQRSLGAGIRFEHLPHGRLRIDSVSG